MKATTEQIRELASTIASEAEAIATGTFTGPLYGLVSQLSSNVSTLRSWIPDDRSGNQH